MSKLFDKFLTKMLAVIVIIVFIIGFREMILTDDNTATAFGALMGMLPFAEVVTDVICKILRYQYEIPVISTASVWTDLIRLALMACLQPIIVGLLTAMFLPLPAGDGQLRAGSLYGQLPLSCERAPAHHYFRSPAGAGRFMVFGVPV